MTSIRISFLTCPRVRISFLAYSIPMSESAFTLILQSLTPLYRDWAHLGQLSRVVLKFKHFIQVLIQYWWGYHILLLLIHFSLNTFFLLIQWNKFNPLKINMGLTIKLWLLQMYYDLYQWSFIIFTYFSGDSWQFTISILFYFWTVSHEKEYSCT